MKRASAALYFFLLLLLPLLSLGCDDVEYAQVKDEIKTKGKNVVTEKRYCPAIASFYVSMNTVNKMNELHAPTKAGQYLGDAEQCRKVAAKLASALGLPDDLDFKSTCPREAGILDSQQVLYGKALFDHMQGK